MKELRKTGRWAARYTLLFERWPLRLLVKRWPLRLLVMLWPRRLQDMRRPGKLGAHGVDHAGSSPGNVNTIKSLKVGPYRANSAASVDLLIQLSSNLREPVAIAARMLKANKRYLHKVEKTRNHPASAKTLQSHISRIEIPALLQFIEMHRDDPGSRILASFHFGDFLYGLNKLVASQPPAITAKVLSQTEYTSVFLENMAKGFGPDAPPRDSQLMLATTKPQALSAFLRQPSTTLLMFADLPCSYGETVRVKFLGRWAWFPKGIAVLALASRVSVVPVICYSEGPKNYVELGKRIVAARLPKETTEAAVIRITQRLIEFFEYFFCQHQEQWRYLSALPNYFVEPHKEGSIQ